jgi:uncharacterized protein
MSAEANKELVTQTWRSFVKGDLKAVFANMSDEISWLIPGDIPNLSGLRKGKPALVDFARQAAKMFPQGLTSEIHRTYADGDTVILEMTNQGRFAGGNDYLNEYCFIFEIEAGKIRRVREYVDTKRVTDLRAKAGLE